MTIAIDHGTFPQRLEVPLSDPFSTSTTLLVLRARHSTFPVEVRPSPCLWGVGGDPCPPLLFIELGSGDLPLCERPPGGELDILYLTHLLVSAPDPRAVYCARGVPCLMARSDVPWRHGPSILSSLLFTLLLPALPPHTNFPWSHICW